MIRVMVAVLLLAMSCVAMAEKADLVVVKKSESRLYLHRAGQPFASFKIKLGAHPKGHKRQKDDERTPEGRYVLDSKNAGSKFYKSIHISYPNEQDRAAARVRGVDPGGEIMIHGQKNGLSWLTPISQLFNWTDGCIALRNKDMDAVWKAVDAGTPIEIYP